MAAVLFWAGENPDTEAALLFLLVSTMATTPRVIDWDEAMEQCGDDEEFLRELLADLRGETDAQVAKIEETIRVRIHLYPIFCHNK